MTDGLLGWVTDDSLITLMKDSITFVLCMTITHMFVFYAYNNNTNSELHSQLCVWKLTVVALMSLTRVLILPLAQLIMSVVCVTKGYNLNF